MESCSAIIRDHEQYIEEFCVGMTEGDGGTFKSEIENEMREIEVSVASIAIMVKRFSFRKVSVRARLLLTRRPRSV